MTDWGWQPYCTLDDCRWLSTWSKDRAPADAQLAEHNRATHPQDSWYRRVLLHLLRARLWLLLSERFHRGLP